MNLCFLKDFVKFQFHFGFVSASIRRKIQFWVLLHKIKDLQECWEGNSLIWKIEKKSENGQK